MRKDLIRCFLLLLSLVLAGCITHQGAVHATVIDADTGAPIPGAVVVVQWEGTFHGLVHSSTQCIGTSATTTNADGKFRIPSWTVHGYDISDVTAEWRVYKPGYPLTRATFETADRKHFFEIIDQKQFRIKPFPAAVRARLSAEYYLRYVGKSAEGVRGCSEPPGKWNGDKEEGVKEDVYAPLRIAMADEAGSLAKSPYERYLVEKIKAALTPGYGWVIPPHIDIIKFSPSAHPSVGNWHDEDVIPTFTISGSTPNPPAVPQLIVFCTKAVSGESHTDDGCEINMRRDGGDTLLMGKADNGDAVEELLKRGADPGIQNLWTGNNVLSSLLKSARKHGKYNDPSTLKALRLLAADARTRVAPDVRAELADQSKWRMSEPAEKDFYMEVRERIKSLPDTEEIVRLDKSFFVNLPEGPADEPFRLGCTTECDKPTGRWEYY